MVCVRAYCTAGAKLRSCRVGCLAIGAGCRGRCLAGLPAVEALAGRAVDVARAAVVHATHGAALHPVEAVVVVTMVMATHHAASAGQAVAAGQATASADAIAAADVSVGCEAIATQALPGIRLAPAAARIPQACGIT